MTDTEVLMLRNTDCFAKVAILTNGNKFAVKKISIKNSETFVRCSDGVDYSPDYIERIVSCGDLKSLQKELSFAV